MTSRKSERNQKWQIKAAKRNKNDFPPRLNIYIFFTITKWLWNLICSQQLYVRGL